MSPAVLVLPGVILALLVLAAVLVSLYGQHLARLRWDRYYRRAAARSLTRRRLIEELDRERWEQRQREKAERKAEHTAVYRDLNNWNHQFNMLLVETKGTRR